MTLNWTASTSSNVTGYNVYRATRSGGPYTKLTSAPVAGTSYTDVTVQGGQTYYYVTTAVDSGNNESVYSNQVTAVVPYYLVLGLSRSSRRVAPVRFLSREE